VLQRVQEFAIVWSAAHHRTIHEPLGHLVDFSPIIYRSPGDVLGPEFLITATLRGSQNNRHIRHFQNALSE
jgi:hypothetical protein